jgi:delta 1-pyrroline-5-carboxylate dehydrogenase
MTAAVAEPRPGFLDGPLRLFIDGEFVGTQDVRYGLAAGIWTRDTSRALRVADQLQAGTVWINTYGMFDPAVPFGGRKHSGFGRELGEEALEPYLQSKSIWLDLEAAVPQSGQGISR